MANRLPVRRLDGGGSAWTLSSGGLVTALVPVLRENSGVWIGWPGDSSDDDVPASYEGIELRAVPISEEEYDEFYLGFANATLWPLYHDAIRPPTFDRSLVARVRQRSTSAMRSAAAEAAARERDGLDPRLPAPTRPRDAAELRPDVRIGYFLHIPFPPRELFVQLPWRREILEGLLGADLVGFQVPGGASNFARLARRVAGATGTGRDGALRGPPDPRSVRFRSRSMRRARGAGGRSCRAGASARDPCRARRPEFVLLGVDRLDYTKGIDRRLRAVGELFADGTLDASRHVVVQIAVPSREEDAHYQRERENLERLIGEINGEHASVGRAPIHYLYQSVAPDELVALYLAADVMLVTPLRDGMNLVAKEYVACRVDGHGTYSCSASSPAPRWSSGARSS